jgi:hypothetical protein
MSHFGDERIVGSTDEQRGRARINDLTTAARAEA